MRLDLSAIRARAEAATEGPWTARRQWNEGNCLGITVGGPDEFGDYDEITEDSYAFAAQARADIPALVEEVERLRGVVRELRASHWREVWHHPDEKAAYDAATERMVNGE